MGINVFVMFSSTKSCAMKTRQGNKRQAASAADTRKETDLNDGLYKRQRQKAEAHIATLVCRFSYFDSSTQRYRFPKGKPKEVFQFHSTKKYSNLNVSMTRVMDRVYRQLSDMKKERDVHNVDDEEEQEEEQEETNVSSYVLRFILLWF